MTDEERTCKAMLLDMEYDPRCPWFRKRTGEGRFNGCALFSYYDPETLELVHRDHSELDMPLKEAMNHSKFDNAPYEAVNK